MKVASVLGTVTLVKKHPALQRCSLRLVRSLSLEEITDPDQASGEEWVAVDPLGAGPGQIVALSEGREAAQPYAPEVKPIDAYIAALLDHIQVDEAR